MENVSNFFKSGLRGSEEAPVGKAPRRSGGSTAANPRAAALRRGSAAGRGDSVSAQQAAAPGSGVDPRRRSPSPQASIAAGRSGRWSRGGVVGAGGARKAGRGEEPGLSANAGAPSTISRLYSSERAALSLAQLRAVFDWEEERTEELKGGVHDEEAAQDLLRRQLADARAEDTAMEAVLMRLGSEVSEAREDVSLLARDLPAVLDSRCEDLRRQLARIEALTERSRKSRHEEEVLAKERGRRRQDADLLWEEAEEWRLQNEPLRGTCRSSAAKVSRLGGDHWRKRMTASEMEAAQQREAQSEEHQVLAQKHLSKEVERMTAKLIELRQLHEDQALQSWGQTASLEAARRLEVEGLERSLNLHQRKVAVKSREAIFWREQAERLGREQQKAQGSRSAEVAGMMLPIPGPERLPGRLAFQTPGLDPAAASLQAAAPQPGSFGPAAAPAGGAWGSSPAGWEPAPAGWEPQAAVPATFLAPTALT